MISDSKVIQHLNDSGRINDSILVSNINAILNRPRHLDDVPKPLKLVSVKQPEVCGIATEFKVLYNQNYKPTDDGCAEIKIQGKSRECDYSVYAIMKSLVMLGINKNEERAIACRDLFMQILHIPNAYIKERDLVIHVLVPNGEFYHDTICDAVCNEVFGEERLVRFIVMRLAIDKPDYASFAEDIVKMFDLKTRDSLNEFIEAKYKEAKADKTYTGKTRGVDHGVVAMDYLYRTWGDK